MKKLLILVLLCLPFVAEAQNTGIGTTSPLEFFSVGASSQFRVDASGNVVRIRDVQYSFPSAQATSAGLVLVNNGSGTLSWSKVTSGSIMASGTASSVTFLRGDGAWSDIQSVPFGDVEEFSVTGATPSFTLTNTNARLILMNRGNEVVSNGPTNPSSVSITIPSASSFSKGTTLIFMTYNVQSGTNPANAVTLTSASSTLVSRTSSGDMSGGIATTVSFSGWRLISDGVSKWYIPAN